MDESGLARPKDFMGESFTSMAKICNGAMGGPGDRTLENSKIPNDLNWLRGLDLN